MSTPTTYPAHALANGFIAAAATPAATSRGDVTPTRTLSRVEVEHLVYVAHGLTLAMYDRPLLADPVVAVRERLTIPTLRAAIPRAGTDRPLVAFDPELGTFREVEPPPPSDAVACWAVQAVWARYAFDVELAVCVDAQGKGSPWAQIAGRRGFRPGTVVPDAMTERYFAEFAAAELSRN